eukprot:INCI12859.2.p1 GENE.INCI12859.2~~INCI12859.2.p1  ORF type:complete len:1055 (-),score=149.35 INCI12859.2:331-3495(-)
MLPSINPNASSFSGSATAEGYRRYGASSFNIRARPPSNEHSWRGMHSNLAHPVGGSPYGPGRIENTAHEQVIVNSFRDFMSSAASDSTHSFSSLEYHVRKFRTVTWSIAAVDAMSHLRAAAKNHQRHVERDEYYAKMRGSHKEHLKGLELEKLSSSKPKHARKKRATRHSIGKSKPNSSRVKTPRSTYIANCRSLGVVPDARIIVGTDQQTYFNFAQAGCSSDQIIALIQALSECHSAIVEQLNVSTNSFSNVDLTKLVSSLRVDEIVSLDVSCNVVGSSTAVELRDLILNEVANLQDLNLNSCHIRRGQFDTLCAAFERGHTLRRLNLGRNNIDDSMASKLLECIRESRIEELDLSWNNINVAASSFLECKKLRWLNLDTNNIKKGTEKAWATALVANRNLIWLDISGAAFSAKECRAIANALKLNHTLLELRMDQMHSCEVHTDALGFLVVYDHVVDEKPHTQAKVYEWLDLPHFLCRQTNKADIDAALSGVGDDTHNATFDAMVAIEERKASAWITDGWSHFTFLVDPSQLCSVVPGGFAPEPFSIAGGRITQLFIHLQADNFSATEMVPSESRVSPATSPKTSGTTTASTRGLWRVDRIVPPGRQFFFVTCVLDNGDRTILISRQWAHQDIQCVPDTQDDTGEVTYRIVNSLVDSTAAPGDSPKRSKPKNKQSKQKKSKIGGSTKKVGRRAHGNSSAGASVATIGDVETLTVNYYDVLVRLPQQPLTLGRCVPRPGPIVDVEAWSLKKSVFVPRLKESDSRSFYNTPGLMRQAFKHDWKMSNIPAFVTDVKEQMQVWKIMKGQYSRLMDIFFYCAGVGMGFSAGEQAMHKWSWMTFSRWVASIGLQEGETALSANDTDIIFITCNVKVNNEEDKPDRFLSRYEFLQAIVRLAMKRYAWKDGVGIPESVSKLLDEYVYPHSKHIRSNDDWRRERLYTEGVSNYFLSILRRLRAKYLVLAAGGGWADEVGGKLSYAEYKDFILTHKLLDGVKRVNIDSIHLDERIEGKLLDAQPDLCVHHSITALEECFAVFCIDQDADLTNCIASLRSLNQ